MSLNELELRVIELLSQDARLDAAQMARHLGAQEADVAAAVKRLQQERVIVGHTVLIDWDRAGSEMVQAVIEVRVTPQREQGFDAIAARIYRFDEVKACYLMSGGYDLMVVVEATTLKQLALFVSSKLAAIENVLSTATHFVLKKYKSEGIIMAGKLDDQRLVVSP